MNELIKKFFKILVAMLGGVNTAFSMVIPISVAFLVINTYSDTLGDLNILMILWTGIISSFYRAISLWNGILINGRQY